MRYMNLRYLLTYLLSQVRFKELVRPCLLPTEYFGRKKTG